MARRGGSMSSTTGRASPPTTCQRSSRCSARPVAAQPAPAAAWAEEFDRLLWDVAMPGMEGYELVKALRARPQTAHLPAIALTGFGRSQDARRAIAAGFDAHIAKPIAMDETLRIIEGLQ